MSKTVAHYILLAIIMVLAQVIVFNHICLFNVAIPFVFIYLIVSLPLTISPNWLLTIGFFLGLTVDAFSDTPGMNAMACTIMAMMRKWVLHLYFNREDDLSVPVPSSKTLGMVVYLKYMTTLVFIYCFIIFFIESFTFFKFSTLLLRVVCSTIFTSALLLGIDSITNKHSEKRL